MFLDVDCVESGLADHLGDVAELQFSGRDFLEGLADKLAVEKGES